MPIGDPSAVETVWRELDGDPVAGEDADVVGAHLPRKVTQNRMAVFQFDGEHRIGQRLFDAPFGGDGVGVLPARSLFDLGRRSRRRSGRFSILWLLCQFAFLRARVKARFASPAVAARCSKLERTTLA